MSTVRLIRFDTGTTFIVESKHCVATFRGEEGFLLYGPFEERDPGRYRVVFEVAYGSAPPPIDDAVCVIFDVAADRAKQILVEKHLLYSEMHQDLTKVVLEFEVLQRCELEYRVKASGHAAVIARTDVDVERLPAAVDPVEPAEVA